MAKWDDKENLHLTFDMPADERMEDFVDRMAKEHAERREAFARRIKQLFDEKVELEGPRKDEAYRQLLNLFSVGYQCGWADLKRLQDKAREKWT